MKKLLLLPITLFLLASCSPPTQQEIEDKKKLCALDGRDIKYSDGVFFGGEILCKYKEQEKTPMDCIREYTSGLDEKYNNPDTVSNLREDEYSKVVKTCNEVFGKSLSGSVNE